MERISFSGGDGLRDSAGVWLERNWHRRALRMPCLHTASSVSRSRRGLLFKFTSYYYNRYWYGFLHFPSFLCGLIFPLLLFRRLQLLPSYAGYTPQERNPVATFRRNGYHFHGFLCFYAHQTRNRCAPTAVPRTLAVGLRDGVFYNTAINSYLSNR